jgi:hypothetical protein
LIRRLALLISLVGLWARAARDALPSIAARAADAALLLVLCDQALSLLKRITFAYKGLITHTKRRQSLVESIREQTRRGRKAGTQAAEMRITWCSG